MSTLSLPGSQRPPITTIEEGVQYEIDNKNDLPLTLVDNLGHGGTATVEKVQDQQTGTVFARKSFKFQGNRVEALRIFKNEVHVINRLAPHHHIVRVFATYIAKREVGLLITPVANGGSLDDLLQTVREDGLTVEESRLLSSSFSCLLSGLRFIHERRIRHKDIKPHNILVHDGSFLYTDFGGSLDYSEFTRSTTTGLPTSITKRYAAPEIHNSSPRSSATDIFSLGCVFFEILSALGFCPSTETLTPYGFYHKHMRHALTTSLSDESSIIGTLVMVKESTLSMLMSSPKQRPSAERLVRQHLTDPTTFCARCKIILLPIMLCTPVIEHSDTQHDGDESNNKKELTCPVCHVVCQSPSDYKRHRLRHEKPFICDFPGCKRNGNGFYTRNDLDRHRLSVHGVRRLNPSYRCAVESCKLKAKVWPTLDIFKQHLEDEHQYEDHIELISQSRVTSPSKIAGSQTSGSQSVPRSLPSHLVYPQEHS